MEPVRYRIVEAVPEIARSARFCDLREDQIRLRCGIEDGHLTIVATGLNVAACEALLRSLGAVEIGVDLCG